MAARSTRQMRAQAAVLHAGTPTVTSPFHTLALYRAEYTPGVSPRLLSERTVKDPSARATRIFGARALLNEVTANADAETVTALDGRPLSLHTADGDVALRLQDSAGRPLWSLNAQQTATAMSYEAASLSGRPLSLTEMAAGAPLGRVRERYCYAPAGESYWKARNLCGHVRESCNNAGIDRSLSLSLTGQSLASEQCLLKVEIEQPDWFRTTEEDVEAPLEVLNRLDATGALLSTTHAAGVTTLEIYGISGAREQTRVRYMKGGKVGEVVTLRDARYAANSRLLEQTAGNGVLDRYEYDPRVPRLKRRLTARPVGHPLGGLVISDLHYEHDPVGNILSLDDQGADPEWHNNLQATGLRQYAYDTLNRLVSATGRERVLAARHHPSSGIRSDPSAGQVWAPYKEEYSYDDGNNLWRIWHNAGAGQRTVELDVALGSNHAVMKGQGHTPETGFLAGGLQKQLAGGGHLQWHADNQLKAVTLIRRNHEDDDEERYHYADGARRTRKALSVKVGGGRQTTLTTYTHAFELRQRALGGVSEPQRHVVITTMGTARLVMSPPNGEAQLRFGFSDHLNSSGGETDAAGKVIVREEYAPYGGTVGEDEPATEVDNLTQRTLRHAGKERDATGLYFYGWRYYQPEVGRWLSADPGGLIDGVNLFRMVKNSPVNFHDDNGRVPLDVNALRNNNVGGYPATSVSLSLLNEETPNDVLMREEMEHSEIDDYKISSFSGQPPQLSGFTAEFLPNVWIISFLQRDPILKAHASTVVLEQYRLVSKANNFYGTLPTAIVFSDVVNQQAILSLKTRFKDLFSSSQRQAYSRVKRFLGTPGLGMFTTGLINRLGLEATAVSLHDNKFIKVEVRPATETTLEQNRLAETALRAQLSKQKADYRTQASNRRGRLTRL
ncbi:RHS repeat-associated core domain-containing protein [Pseudomonas putida]|uniref:RHS repeat protein n=1 Tax=Pseudomonas putida TaxID=303 RepID=A0A6I6Y5W7_PSEPU|nr:RHS repeat-associated core domain-containing protein [Pseudomonas putida]QHG66976.2 RHS repeat protein [Pseudomonas putida]